MSCVCHFSDFEPRIAMRCLRVQVVKLVWSRECVFGLGWRLLNVTATARMKDRYRLLSHLWSSEYIDSRYLLTLWYSQYCKWGKSQEIRTNSLTTYQVQSPTIHSVLLHLAAMKASKWQFLSRLEWQLPSHYSPPSCCSLRSFRGSTRASGSRRRNWSRSTAEHVAET